jgi:hypothetical protein
VLIEVARVGEELHDVLQTFKRLVRWRSESLTPGEENITGLLIDGIGRISGV